MTEQEYKAAVALFLQRLRDAEAGAANILSQNEPYHEAGIRVGGVDWGDENAFKKVADYIDGALMAYDDLREAKAPDLERRFSPFSDHVSGTGH